MKRTLQASHLLYLKPYTDCALVMKESLHEDEFIYIPGNLVIDHAGEFDDPFLTHGRQGHQVICGNQSENLYVCPFQFAHAGHQAS